MIVTAWIIPPSDPRVSQDAIQPGIKRIVFKDRAATAITPHDFCVDLRHTILAKEPPGTVVDFGPVSHNGMVPLK